MIKKFNVTVNGNAYEVEVEEIKDGAVQVARPVAPAPTAPKTSAPKTAPTAPKTSAPKTAPVASGAGSVVAPMPGTIIDVVVKEGDTVKAGQLCVVLEAMKMENELPAPCDGVVKAVNVNKGSAVNTDEVLVVIG